MIDVTLAIVTPKGRVREAESNWMFCLVIVFSHMAFYISRTGDSLTLETDPILLLALTDGALKL